MQIAQSLVFLSQKICELHTFLKGYRIVVPRRNQYTKSNRLEQLRRGDLMNEILAMKHITKTYPGVKALDDVSVSFIQGEVHAVMGENGAGKSTLMKVLNGMISSDSGEIWFEGKQVAIRSPRDARALGIAMIHQELNPIKDLTVAENMFVGRYPQVGCFVDWKTVYDRCRALFQHWNVDFDPKMKVRFLSTAETQMLEILKAISYDAKLIIMDEPTSALTEREVQKLFSFIEELKSKQITIHHDHA